MTGLVRFMGWLAVTVGVIAAVVPLADASLLPVGDAIVIAFFGIFAGIGLVAVAKLLDVVEKIEANTNWFSVSAAGASRSQDGNAIADGNAGTAASTPPREAEPASDPQPEPSGRIDPIEPDPVPEPARIDTSRAPLAGEDLQPVSAPEAEQPSSEPEVYNADVHPPAIEEWSYGTRRVMTLRDGSVATELDGVWYRFVSVQDLAAYVEPAVQEAAGTS